MARIIALANQKGGVGKTTTAVNLAVGLALRDRRVLLVDLDPQANATFAVLGMVEPTETVYDLLIRGATLDQVTIRQVVRNLDLVPSTIDLAGAEVELLGTIGGQNRLAGQLRNDVLPYDYIVVDSPPSLGLLTINALAAADEVMIPVSTSVFALKGIMQLETTVEQVRRNLNRSDLRIGGVVVTLFDHTNVARDVRQMVLDRFPEAAFETVIPKNVKLEEAHSRGESVLTYAPEATGALAYQALVEEVIARE